MVITEEAKTTASHFLEREKEKHPPQNICLRQAYGFVRGIKLYCCMRLLMEKVDLWFIWTKVRVSESKPKTHMKANTDTQKKIIRVFDMAVCLHG